MTLYNSWLANPALRNPDYSKGRRGGVFPFFGPLEIPEGYEYDPDWYTKIGINISPFRRKKDGQPVLWSDPGLRGSRHRTGPWDFFKPFGGGRPMTREEMIDATKTGPWGLPDPRWNPRYREKQENAQPAPQPAQQPKAPGAWKNSPLGRAYTYGIKPMLNRLQQAGKPTQPWADSPFRNAWNYGINPIISTMLKNYNQSKPWADSPFNRAWNYGIKPTIDAMQKNYNARFPRQVMQDAAGNFVNSIPIARRTAVNDFVRNSWWPPEDYEPPKPETGHGGPTEYAQ